MISSNNVIPWMSLNCCIIVWLIVTPGVLTLVIRLCYSGVCSMCVYTCSMCENLQTAEQPQNLQNLYPMKICIYTVCLRLRKNYTSTMSYINHTLYNKHKLSACNYEHAPSKFCENPCCRKKIYFSCGPILINSRGSYNSHPRIVAAPQPRIIVIRATACI